jgi:hypothetical protein
MKPRPVILSSSHSPSYLHSEEQARPSQPGSGVARGKAFPRTGACNFFKQFVTGFCPTCRTPSAVASTLAEVDYSTNIRPQK